jgi:hypothetical protein
VQEEKKRFVPSAPRGRSRRTLAPPIRAFLPCPPLLPPPGFAGQSRSVLAAAVLPLSIPWSFARGGPTDGGARGVFVSPGVGQNRDMIVEILNFGMRTNMVSLIDSTNLVPYAMLKTSCVTSHHTHPSAFKGNLWQRQCLRPHVKKECWITIRPSAFKGNLWRWRGQSCWERVLGFNALGCPVIHEIDPQETLSNHVFPFLCESRWYNEGYVWHVIADYLNL